MLSQITEPVQDLEHYVPHDPSVKSMLNCIGELQSIGHEVMDSNYSTFKVLELSRKHKISDLLTKKRSLLKEGILSTGTDMHSVYLFSDCLLVITPSKQWFIPFKVTDDITGEYNIAITKDSDANALEIDEHEVEFHVSYKFDNYDLVKEWSKAFKACLE